MQLLNKSEYCYVCVLNNIHGSIKNYYREVAEILRKISK